MVSGGTKLKSFVTIKSSKLRPASFRVNRIGPDGLCVTNKLTKMGLAGLRGDKSGIRVTNNSNQNLTRWFLRRNIEIKSTKMWPAGSRGDKIEIMIEQVGQNVTRPAGDNGAKIEIMSDQVCQNETSWCQWYIIWIKIKWVYQNVTRGAQNWDHGSPSQLKCVQLGLGGTCHKSSFQIAKVSMCLIHLPWPLWR
jgi:hypothetical protein